MDQIELGFILPDDEETFNRYLRALGLCLWITYTRQNPGDPREDHRTFGKKYKLVATITEAD